MNKCSTLSALIRLAPRRRRDERATTDLNDALYVPRSFSPCHPEGESRVAGASNPFSLRPLANDRPGATRGGLPEGRAERREGLLSSPGTPGSSLTAFTTNGRACGAANPSSAPSRGWRCANVQLFGEARGGGPSVVGVARRDLGRGARSRSIRLRCGPRARGSARTKRRRKRFPRLRIGPPRRWSSRPRRVRAASRSRRGPVASAASP